MPETILRAGQAVEITPDHPPSAALRTQLEDLRAELAEAEQYERQIHDALLANRIDLAKLIGARRAAVAEGVTLKVRILLGEETAAELGPACQRFTLVDAEYAIAMAAGAYLEHVELPDARQQTEQARDRVLVAEADAIEAEAAERFYARYSAAAGDVVTIKSADYENAMDKAQSLRLQAKAVRDRLAVYLEQAGNARAEARHSGVLKT